MGKRSWDIGCEVDITGSKSCPMDEFGTEGLEPSGFATRELVKSALKPKY
jgi:hypothetical protein